MLSNAYFLANFFLIQPRTSPPKICKILQFFANLADLVASSLHGLAAHAERGGDRGEVRGDLLVVAVPEEDVLVDPLDHLGCGNVDKPRLDGEGNRFSASLPASVKLSFFDPLFSYMANPDRGVEGCPKKFNYIRQEARS